MSHGPSTLGSMTTSSFAPTAPTISVTSSSIQGELSALMRVHRPVAPKSLAFAMAMKPARAASLASAGMASSRLPSTTSTCAISSGSLARSFSTCGGTKWIMRSRLTGSSASGRGAPIASGLKKLRGRFTQCSPRSRFNARSMQVARQVGGGEGGRPRAGGGPLLQRDIGFADHLSPQLRLLGEEFGGLGAGLGDRLHLNCAHLVGDIGPAEALDQVAMDPVGQGGGRLRRRDH